MIWVHVVDINLVDDIGVVGHQGFGSCTISFPSTLREWQGRVPTELVSNRVPYGMEVLNSIFDWNMNHITTEVTLWVFMINSSSCMKWLMNISNIVDHESQGCGIGIFITSLKSIALDSVDD